MSQTISFDRWILWGSGWETSYQAQCTISVSRSYGSDKAKVSVTAKMSSYGGDSNTTWTFWIKIGSTWYSGTLPTGTHWAGEWYSKTFSWDISVGATSGTLSGQVTFQAEDVSGVEAYSAYKNWSQDYGTKGASTISNATDVSLNTAGTATSTVTFTSYSSSFTHKIQATLGSTSTSEITVAGGNNVSKSGTLTFGTAFINAINTAKTGTAVVTLKTYSGSTLIGTSTKNITLTVPSGINPGVAISSVAKSPSPQVNNPFTKICSALDKAVVTWTFAAQYGSAINSGTVTVDGIAASNTSGSLTSGTLKNCGMLTAAVSATDKRGNTGSDSTTFPVYEYFYPYVSVKYKRSGGLHKLALSGGFASVGGENTTRALKLDVYKNGSKVNQADINLSAFISVSAVAGSSTPYNDYYEISGDYTIPITDIDGHGTDISDITTDTYTFVVTATDRIAAASAKDVSGVVVMTFGAGGTRIFTHKPLTAEGGIQPMDTADVTGVEILPTRTSDELGGRIKLDRGVDTSRDAYIDTYDAKLRFIDRNPSTVVRASLDLTDGYFDAGGYKINGTNVVDFPVEYGTSNGWRYRKWNSGWFEAWHNRIGEDIPANQSMVLFKVNFPFTLPSVDSLYAITFGSYQNTTAVSNASIFDVSTWTTTQLSIRAFRNYTDTANWGISPRCCIQIQGRWK